MREYLYFIYKSTYRIIQYESKLLKCLKKKVKQPLWYDSNYFEYLNSSISTIYIVY